MCSSGPPAGAGFLLDRLSEPKHAVCAKPANPPVAAEPDGTPPPFPLCSRTPAAMNTMGEHCTAPAPIVGAPSSSAGAGAEGRASRTQPSPPFRLAALLRSLFACGVQALPTYITQQQTRASAASEPVAAAAVAAVAASSVPPSPKSSAPAARSARARFVEELETIELEVLEQDPFAAATASPTSTISACTDSTTSSPRSPSGPLSHKLLPSPSAAKAPAVCSLPTPAPVTLAAAAGLGPKGAASAVVASGTGRRCFLRNHSGSWQPRPSRLSREVTSKSMGPSPPGGLVPHAEASGGCRCAVSATAGGGGSSSSRLLLGVSVAQAATLALNALAPGKQAADAPNSARCCVCGAQRLPCDAASAPSSAAAAAGSDGLGNPTTQTSAPAGWSTITFDDEFVSQLLDADDAAAPAKATGRRASSSLGADDDVKCVMGEGRGSSGDDDDDNDDVEMATDSLSVEMFLSGCDSPLSESKTYMSDYL